MGFPIIQINRANWCDLFAFKGKKSNYYKNSVGPILTH